MSTTDTLVDRVEVIHPDGRHIIADTPPYLAEAIYPDCRGFVRHRVEGYDHPDGIGFVIVHRH